ncbi:MAG: Flp family type IVb pilin [Oligoflexia bacterium]
MTSTQFSKKPTHPSSPSGQGLTEYLILLILISMVSIAAVRTLGSRIKGKLQQAHEEVNGLSFNR